MQLQGCRLRFSNNLREAQEVRKLLPCTFPQPAAKSVALEETKMHRQEWLAVGPILIQSIF